MDFMNAELLKQPDHFASKLVLFCAAECNQEVSEEVRVVSIKWLLKHILEDIKSMIDRLL